MKKLKVIGIVILMLFLVTGCKNTEQKGNMMKLELNCDAEDGYFWQTTILNSNVIKSMGDEFLYKDQDDVLETKQRITFKALEAGSAQIEIKYINPANEDNDKDYNIKYIIEVDQDLNIKILSKSGNFYEDEVLEPTLYPDFTKDENESQVSEN